MRRRVTSPGILLVLNPTFFEINMSAVAEAVSGSVDNIPAIFQRLADNAPNLALSSVEQRIERLKKLIEVTLAYRERVIEAVKKERDIHQCDIDAELMMIKVEAEFAIRNLKDWVKPQKVQGSIMTLGKKSYIHYEPKGVCLAIGAWNAPIAEALVPAVGAIAAGNAVLIKPSELSPHSSALLAEMVADMSPDNEMTVVEGGAEVAQALLAQPFDHIFYIGSHNVGKLIAKAAAEHFASCTLEMGGKNPAIVDKSADIAEAAMKTAWGRMGNGGAMCVSPDYVLVEASVKDEYIDEVKKALDSMYNPEGKGAQNSEEFGRIINQRHWARIKALLDDALEKGAELLYGGEADEGDLYIAPTVITGVTDDMKISQEEIFGPIMVITPYTSRDEAIAETRKQPKPLSCYIFAKDREVIDWFLARTTAGNTVINHNVIQSGTNPHLPFGGVNASGTGRLGGWCTFAEASNARSVVEEGPPMMNPRLFFPPYQPKYRDMIEKMLLKSVHMPNGMINFINGIVAVRKFFSRKY